MVIMLRGRPCCTVEVVLCKAGDAEEADGPAGALLPPAQPALLTMTRDGVMRVWVEVTMAAQQQRPAEGATSPERAPAWGAARGIQASFRQPFRFYTSVACQY